jgi:transposase
LTRAVVEDVDFDDAAQAVVVSVRPNAKARRRCGRCSRRSPRFDHGEGRRRWRAVDLGTTKVFLEPEVPRVRCRSHGVVVGSVPWARHGAGHTRDFDDLAAWLAVRTSKSAVCQLLRIAWRTVGAIVTRVNAEVETKVDRLEGLRRIGIDEISYKRGHRYLIVVVNHDTGALVWAGPGRNDAALNVFFDELGPERSALLTRVSADMADWIARVVKKRAPNAVRCADPFHVVAWGIEALDVERRRAWNQAAGRLRTGTRPRSARSTGTAARSKRARYALWKNPQDLTDRQRHELDRIAKTDPRLARLPPQRSVALRVRRSRRRRQRSPAVLAHLGPPVTAPRVRRSAPHDHRSPRRHRRTLEHGLSNALVESTNTKIRLLTRTAFGFHGHQPLIALALLALGSPPRLPGR